MNPRYPFAAGIISILAFLTMSCQVKSPQASKTKSEFSCNLAESEKASNEASKKAFTCAYDSLKLAASSASGFAGPILKSLDGVKNLVEFAVSAQATVQMVHVGFQELNGNPNGPGGTDSASQVLETTGKASDLAGDLNDQYKKACATSACKCVAQAQPLFGPLLKVATTAYSLKDKKSFSTSEITGLLSLPQGFLGEIQGLFNAGGHCSDALNGNPAPNFAKASAGFKAITDVVGQVTTLGRCGVELAEGGYVLYQNSACLADDIKNYYDSRERLEKSRESYVQNSKVPTEDGHSGVNACMAKYGIFLQRQSFYSYLYRSNICGDYCGNGSKANSFYSSSLKDIYPRQDDYAWCSENATSAQSADAVRQCAVYCCDQDGTCADEAMTRAGF